MRSGEWQKLHNLIGTVKWGEMEFMRKAFLTAALDHIGEEGEAAREWKSMDGDGMWSSIQRC